MLIEYSPPPLASPNHHDSGKFLGNLVCASRKIESGHSND